MRAWLISMLLAGYTAITAVAGPRMGYLPAVGPGPLRLQMAFAGPPAALPPLLMRDPEPVQPPAAPPPTEGADTARIGVGTTPGTAIATTPANPAVAETPTPPPGLLALLPFFSQASTNGVSVAPPLFLPPPPLPVVPSSSSRYQTP